MKTVEVGSLEESVKFRVKLEIALRNNAIRIQKLNSDPDRFLKYIGDRESIIRKLLECEGDIIITDDGKRIFP